MESQAKPKIEYIPYICYKCGNLDDFRNMTEVQQKFENGSIKITYLCKKCEKESKTLI
jgi:DNA-directed RNA polymerase subunit RPC12/RpoP